MWFILLWFAVGFASIVFAWVLDMRGKEYDEDYFKQSGMFITALIMTMFGFISPIIVLITAIEDKRIFTKFIYKIANIGVETEDKNNVKE